MFDRILSRMQRLVLEQQYIVTLHADEELDADGFTVYDIESAVLTGKIVERQHDAATQEHKYRVNGTALDGRWIETVTKISATSKVVFITAYAL
jgi:hypothetical protein